MPAENPPFENQPAMEDQEKSFTLELEVLKYIYEHKEDMSSQVNGAFSYEELMQEEGELALSGYYLDIHEGLNILRDKQEGEMNPFAFQDMAFLEYLQYGNFVLPNQIEPSHEDLNVEVTTTLSREVRQEMIVVNNGNDISYQNNSTSEGTILTELKSVNEADLNEREFLMPSANYPSTSTFDSSSSFQDVFRIADTADQESQAPMMLDYEGQNIEDIEAHEELFRHFETQYQDAIYTHNGAEALPIATNPDFSGIGYDLETELDNNRIIAEEIFGLNENALFNNNYIYNDLEEVNESPPLVLDEITRDCSVSFASLESPHYEELTQLLECQYPFMSTPK